jgi:hypothetical protein
MWNQLDALRGLDDSITDKVSKRISELGINPSQVGLGLLPAVNEILAQNGARPIGYRCQQLEIAPGAHWAPCEVLSQIAQGAPSLVTTSTHTSPTRLLQRICGAFPTADIVVLVKSREIGCSMVNSLRADGQNCWYMEKEYALREDQPRPNHRIRVVLQTELALCSLELHKADIVVVTNGVDFVRNNRFGHHTELFNPVRGTFIKPGARLVGIVPEDTHPHDMGLVYPIFGLRTYQLGANGLANLAPLVQWVSRTKGDQTDKRVGKDQSFRKRKEVMVWKNQARNNFIVKQGRPVREEAKGYPFVQGRFGPDTDQALAIVVENLIHKGAILEALASKGISCQVLTHEEIDGETCLPSVLIRADAGTGLLPIGAQEHPLLIVDVKDGAPSFIRCRYITRYNDCCRFWHAGPDPFAQKWLFTQR